MIALTPHLHSSGELAYRLGPVDILQHGLEQARTLGAPGEMRNRLRLSAEYAATHAGALPPWLDFAQLSKAAHLPRLEQTEESEC